MAKDEFLIVPEEYDMTINQPVTAEQFLLAERHVIAGVFARLLPRYHATHGEGHAARYAMAVTNILFSLPAQDLDKNFLESHRQAVDEEIQALVADHEIREIVTEAVTMRIVFASRQRGCSQKDLALPIETLKNLGLFLQGSVMPTPRSFITKAEAFFKAAPR
jgi:hypothetical protein